MTENAGGILSRGALIALDAYWAIKLFDYVGGVNIIYQGTHYIHKASNVEPSEILKLTSKEICSDCGIKVKEAQLFLSETIRTYKAEIERMLSETKKKAGVIDAVYNRFISDANSLYKTTEAELKRRMEDVLK